MSLRSLFALQRSPEVEEGEPMARGDAETFTLISKSLLHRGIGCGEQQDARDLKLIERAVEGGS
jgi:hypothetical protein